MSVRDERPTKVLQGHINISYGFIAETNTSPSTLGKNRCSGVNTLLQRTDTWYKSLKRTQKKLHSPDLLGS